MKTIFSKPATSALMLATIALAAATGCVRYVDRPRVGNVYVVPPIVETEVVIQDDYVYYPSYQVYYSSNRHLYTYREGRYWVSRPAPPHMSVDVLFASPSVRLDFHDSPAHHHAALVRQYPRNWAPPGSNHGPGQNHNGAPGDHRGESHGR